MCSLWLQPRSALGRAERVGRCGAGLPPACMDGSSITAIWKLIGQPFSSSADPREAGADHWWHGWQMGDRGRTVASSCRPTTDRTAPLSTPSPALALLPWARRPARLSNSAGLALTSSRPRPMGSAHLHMRGAGERRQGANPPSHSHSRLASIAAAVGNTQAGDSFVAQAAGVGVNGRSWESHGWLKRAASRQ